MRPWKLLSAVMMGLAWMGGCTDLTAARSEFCANRPDACPDGSTFLSDAGNDAGQGTTDSGSGDSGLGGTDAGANDAGDSGQLADAGNARCMSAGARTDFYVAGTDPAQVAFGDFNGDGWPDLAVDNVASSQVEILTNNQDGTFTLGSPAIAPPGNLLAPGVAAGDLNGDGLVDLVMGTSKSVVVWLSSDAGFLPSVAYASDAGSLAFPLLADFTGNGHLDIAVSSARAFVVLPSQGNGTFAAPIVSLDPVLPTSVNAGSTNVSGRVDLIQTVAFGPFTSGEFTLFANDGTGRFSALSPNDAGPDFATAVGDFNGDHVLDLVVLSPGNAALYLGRGSSRFAYAGPVLVQLVQARRVAAGDFDRDGKLDLMFVGDLVDGGDTGLSVLLGRGDGTFGPETVVADFGQPDSPFDLVLGDLDKNGALDAVVPLYSTGKVAVVLNPCGPSGAILPSCIPRGGVCSAGSTPCCSLGTCTAKQCP